MCPLTRILILALAFAWLATPSSAADSSMETVEVQGSREKVRREVESFVSGVTRMEGELIGRWRDNLCPMVVGVSDAQGQFIRHRLVEVQNTVRKRQEDSKRECRPNLFVIVTDEPEQMIAAWKERDPGLFRWKTREGVSRSTGPGAVRTWHNAIVEPHDGDPIIYSPNAPPQSRLKPSRIQASYWEHIKAVVVLVDARATGKVTLAQLTDYIAMVAMSQLDLTADLGGVNTILKLFAQPQPDVPPVALTEWDFAFLNALYRASYSPMHQQRDLRARMVRELAPR